MVKNEPTPRRTRADVRAQIAAMLDDPATRAWSDGAIARHVGCVPATVGHLRRTNPGWATDQRQTADGRAISAAKQSSGVHKRVATAQNATPDDEIKRPDDSKTRIEFDATADPGQIADAIIDTLGREMTQQVFRKLNMWMFRKDEYGPIPDPTPVDPTPPVEPAPPKRRRGRPAKPASDAITPPVAQRVERKPGHVNTLPQPDAPALDPKYVKKIRQKISCRAFSRRDGHLMDWITKKGGYDIKKITDAQLVEQFEQYMDNLHNGRKWSRRNI